MEGLPLTFFKCQESGIESRVINYPLAKQVVFVFAMVDLVFQKLLGSQQ